LPRYIYRSGFTVMVRSSADNPILSFASSDKPEPSESVSGNVSVGKVARLRGGAGDGEQPTPKWEGQYHDVTVDLRLKVNDKQGLRCEHLLVHQGLSANDFSFRPYSHICAAVQDTVTGKQRSCHIQTPSRSTVSGITGSQTSSR
jgi:hypothetical protein